MGFVISQRSLMDDRLLPVIRIKYKEGQSEYPQDFLSLMLFLDKREPGSESVIRTQSESFFIIIFIFWSSFSNRECNSLILLLSLVVNYEGVNSKHTLGSISFPPKCTCVFLWNICQ